MNQVMNQGPHNYHQTEEDQPLTQQMPRTSLT